MARPICSAAAVCVAALFALPWPCSVCRAEESGPPNPSAQSPAEVLVLQDGGVLVGKISRAGDRYVVSRAGSEIHVPAANVLTTCQRLEEAYEHRRMQMSRPSVDAHLALAEWCLRYGLLPQAARELVDASGLEPLHPRLKLLERRLLAVSKPLPREQEPVLPATHFETATTHDGVAGSNTPLTEELPSGAMERFTRKVQPVLVNNCTISGCHQPGGQQEFQLDRALLHGLGNRRSTTKNLAATLALVDREQPQLSPLLTVPRRSHGGIQSAIFGPRQQAAFKHLEDWVALLTEPNSAEQDTLPAEEGDGDMVAAGSRQRMPVLKSDVEATSDVAQALYVEAEDATPKTRRLRYAAQLKPWQPKDPFDPEIFNRQQRSRQQPAEDVEADAVIQNK